ncbi:MAG: GIY-YIG nuclease family protein, partial [Bacteroidia bacterium]
PELVDAASREAGEALRKKRPNFNFIEMQIPVGSELLCVRNGESVVVQSSRSIMFRGEETSLTNATKQILELDYNVAPGPYWTYNGKLLRDIYNETYI